MFKIAITLSVLVIDSIYRRYDFFKVRLVLIPAGSFQCSIVTIINAPFLPFGHGTDRRTDGQGSQHRSTVNAWLLAAASPKSH